MKLLPIYFPEGLIQEIDEHVKDKHYVSRADYIREAVREKIRRESLPMTEESSQPITKPIQISGVSSDEYELDKDYNR